MSFLNIKSVLVLSFFIAFSVSGKIGYSQCTAKIDLLQGALQGCAEPLVTQFTSTNSTGVASVSWNFGDTTSTANNPIWYFYENPNGGDTTYIVTLTVYCLNGDSATDQVAVEAYNIPHVDFSVDSSRACQLGAPICFTNLSDTSDISNYDWDFGTAEGNSSTFEPCYSYSNHGNKSPSLKVTSNKGCDNTLEKTNLVEILAMPNPDFTFVDGLRIGCHPFTVNITNTSDTIDVNDWEWIWGDGDTVMQKNPPLHTYSEPDTLSIQLIATNSAGCKNATANTIIIKETPVAKVSADSTICAGETIQAQQDTAYSGASYIWDFDNPTSAIGNANGPYTIGWDTGGTKTIHLTIDYNGCTHDDSVQVFVNPKPIVYLEVSVSNDTICEGEQVTFIANPQKYSKYIFSVNGSTEQTSSFNTFSTSSLQQGDKIFVDAKDINGCSSIIIGDSVLINVTPKPQIDIVNPFNSDSICNKDTSFFYAIPDIYDYYYFFDGYKVIQHSSSDTLVYSNKFSGAAIKVMAKENGCLSDTSRAESYLLPIVIEPLDTPFAFCGKSTVNSIEFLWDEVSDATGYLVSINDSDWTTPSGPNTSHYISGLAQDETVTITVKAIGVDPCGDSPITMNKTTCKSIICDSLNYKKPEDISVCKGAEASLFVDSISIPNYFIYWNNDTNLTSDIFTFTPDSTTNITVTLKNTEKPECPIVSKTTEIQIIDPSTTLISSLNGDSVCGGNEIIFTAEPAGFENYVFYKNWHEVQNSPINTYQSNEIKEGDYITLTAINNGCRKPSEDTLTPAVITPLNEAIVFCGKSTSESIQFLWDSIPGATGYEISVNGSGFFSAQQNLSFLIDTNINEGDAITIIVRALGEEPCGDSPLSLSTTCFAEICDSINFNFLPEQEVCENSSITLSVNDISINDYLLSWNNGTPTQNTNHIVVPDGDTNVFVKIINNTQPYCSPVVKYSSISMNPLPIVAITTSSADDTICVLDSVSFIASPPGYDSYVFYDNFLAVQTSGNHEYITYEVPKDGHTITVSATNKGCVNFSEDSISLINIPPLETPQVNCGNSTSGTIEFIWDSIPNALGYIVSINDSDYISPNGNFSHSISMPFDSSAEISVIALGGAPCGNSSPNFNWEYSHKSCVSLPCSLISYTRPSDDTLCFGDQAVLNLSNLSINNYSIQWDSLAPSTETTYTYTPTISDTISIIIADSSQTNCPPSQKFVIINVTPIPEATITASADTICSGNGMNFSVSPVGYDQYSFYSNNTLVHDSTYHIYSLQEMMYDTTIFVKTYNYRCHYYTDTLSVMVINAPPVSSNSSELDNIVCENDSLIITIEPKLYDQYFFHNGSSLLQDSTINYFKIQSIQEVDSTRIDSIVCYAVNNLGCISDTTPVITTSILLQTAVSISTTIDSVCYGDTAFFSASPDSLQEYKFYNNNILVFEDSLSTYFSNSLDFTNNLHVSGKNSHGCWSKPIDTVSVTLIPLSTPTVSTTDTLVCIGDTVLLFASVDSGFAVGSFSWNTGSLGSTTFEFPTSNSYFSVEHTQLGCRSHPDSIFITVDSIIPIADAGIDDEICYNSSTLLNASGGASYEWYPTDGLDDALVANPEASPLESTTYNVIITNITCSSEDEVFIEVDLCLDDITGPIPQIITPNDDNVHDKWIIPDIDYFTENTLVIYNRWGNIVYETTYYQNTWSGTSSKEKELPDGTYFYVLNLGNGKEPYTGYIMIHR